MQPNDAILTVNGLVTRFRSGRRRVNAVNGASFALRRQSCLGIVGESGCGKSATAHSILQLLPPNAYIEGGTVEYTPTPGGEATRLTDYGRNSRQLRGVRGQDIAMIFQDPLSSLNPVYTVGRQIEENIRLHQPLSHIEARQRSIELLQKMGIPKPEVRVDEYPHQFSGGMKQRVMIAIAMACNPKVLIADEPTTALDVTIQAQILELMEQLKQNEGTSIILITHNMGIVAEVCDEVAVMYLGRVVEFGSLEQVFTNPLHPYTKALLRSVPVLGMGRGQRLTPIQGAAPDGEAVFAGCPFAPRCTAAMPLCHQTEPGDSFPENGHRVRCHLCEGGGAL